MTAALDGAAPRRDSRRVAIFHAFTRAVAYERVRRVEFIDAVPKAASGKILRRELRGRDRDRAGA